MRMSSKLTVPDDFDRVPDEQRIAFVQELWDRIAENPARVPVPETHRRILDQRLKEYRADPSGGRTWAEIRDELLAKLRDV
jgi:putative addiction module component (TIGR02574 family)